MSTGIPTISFIQNLPAAKTLPTVTQPGTPAPSSFFTKVGSGPMPIVNHFQANLQSDQSQAVFKPQRCDFLNVTSCVHLCMAIMSGVCDWFTTHCSAP